WGPCHEDAVSLQGAAGPAGDGGGEPGICKLCQDAAVCLILARQWQSSSHGGSRGHAPSWGPQLLPPARMINRSLCESNSSLCSALLIRSHADLPAASPAATAPTQEGRGGPGPAPTGAAEEDRDAGSASSTDTASLLISTGSHSSEDGSPPALARAPRLGASEGTPTPHAGPLLPLVPPGVREERGTHAPCPMYQLVLAGDGGMGKSSFLLRLCTNEFRGVISTLGVDFQIKQLLVDGEQTTLQIWDTTRQER
ncbi:RASEF protein, partial [Sula dactylatra]|nr:RASEF protein [Sula dactylatra]